MAEYIERATVIKALKDNVTEMEHHIYFGSNLGVPDDEIEDIVNEIPSADVEPVKHGHWIDFYGNYETAECSVCEELYEVSDMRESNRMLFEAFSQYYKYCPHCGAKMDGEESG